MKLRCLAFLLALTLPAFAQDWVPAAQFVWPTHHYNVILKNYPVKVGWIDGRPWGNRQDCAPLLNLPTIGDSQIDLERVLAEKGYVIRVIDDTIEAKPGPDQGR